MSDTAVTIDVLPVAHGDCLLVECPVEGRTWRLLVDTGPDECYSALKKRLEQIPVDSKGRRRVDIFVVSHIDHDHIGGAAQLVGDRALNLTIGDVWFNAPSRRPTRGVEEGDSLARILGARDVTLTWNQAFDGRLAVVPADPGFLELSCKATEPRLTLLSPGQPQLDRLFTAWDKELAKLRSKAAEKAPAAAPTSRGVESLDIEALAEKVGPPDRSLPNGSSIGLLLEHRGVRVLLGADVYAGVLAKALRSLADKRKSKGPVPIDLFKVSHHGSRGNISADILKAIQARHYVFSTNNAIFNLPDDDAVAQVIRHGGPRPELWFNYATPRNSRWGQKDLCDRYGYVAHYPTGAAVGLSIALPAKGGGATAGQLASRHELAVIDVQMPVMDGIEATAKAPAVAPARGGSLCVRVRTSGLWQRDQDGGWLFRVAMESSA